MKRIYLLAIVFITTSSYSQTNFQKNEKNDFVKEVASIMKDYYVDKEMSLVLSEQILKQLELGIYDNVNSRDEFAKLIQDQCHKISNDKHIQLRFIPKEDKIKEGGEDNDGKINKEENYGFDRVRVFEDLKIGRVRINVFQSNRKAREKIDEIFKSFPEMETVIIDLRECIGASGDMVNYIMSYFVDTEPIKYLTIYNRFRHVNKDLYTLGNNRIPKENRLLKQKVYILTSNFSFSAAEGFAYHLKHLNRATIIGETTGGGANMIMPVGWQLEDENGNFTIGKYEVLVPIVKVTSPFTGTNWEGVGVKPDIETIADDAWEEAFELASSM